MWAEPRALNNSWHDRLSQWRKTWVRETLHVDALDHLLKMVAQGFSAKEVALFLSDEKGTFDCLAQSGLTPKEVAVWEKQMSSPEDAPAVIFPETKDHNQALPVLGNAVALPLMASGKLYGRLLIGFESPRRFDEGAFQEFQCVAHHVSSVVKGPLFHPPGLHLQNKFEKMLDALGEGVVILSPQGKLMFINEEAAKILGYASAAALKGFRVDEGLRYLDVTDVEGRPRSSDDSVVVKALQGQRAQTYLQVRPRSTWFRRTLRVKAAPVWDDVGRVQYVAVTLCDVTEEWGKLESFRQARAKDTERLQRLQRLLSLTSVMRSPLSRSELLRQVVVEATEGLSAQAALVLEWQDKPQSFQALASEGLTPSWREWAHHEDTRRLWIDVLRHAQPHVLSASTPAGTEVACVPFVIRKETKGLLLLVYGDGKALARLDHSLLATLGEQLGEALAYGDAFEAEQMARDEAQAAQRRSNFLLEVNAEFNRNKNFVEAMRQVASRAATHFGGFCEVALINANDEWESAVVKNEISLDVSSLLALGFQKGIWLQAQLGQVVSVRDVAFEPNLHSRGLRTLLLAPMRNRGQVVGLWCVGSGLDEAYRPPDVSLLESLADSATVAWDNAQLFEKLHHSLRSRDHLLSILSHDMRTPLGVMQMKAQQLRRRLPAHSQMSGYVDAILKAGWNTSDMIRDLLDVAALQAGEMKLPKKPVPLHSLLLEAFQKLRAKGVDGRVRADIASDVSDAVVFCEPLWVSRVFANVFDSLLKKAPTSSTVWLLVHKGEGQVVFSLRASGVHVSATALSHLFGQYWKAGAEVSSIGLGFYIAREVVEAHRGSFEVESSAEEGFCVTFTLPQAMH